MAKIYGLFGSMKGKVADVVMAVRSGEQIVRKYQPIVFNPNTNAQLATRAKLKLMSQLSAIVAPVLGFKKSGSVSARNMFVKRNISKATYSSANEKASVDMLSLDLTGSSIGMPGIEVIRTQNTISLNLASSDSDIDKVVYVFIFVEDGVSFTPAKSLVVEEPSSNNTFPTGETDLPARFNGYAYAYGIKFVDQAARVRYENLIAETGVSALEVIKQMSNSEVTFTKTQSAVIAPGSQS